MDDKSKMALFEKIVRSSFEFDEKNGGFSFSLSALKEFHDTIGLPPEATSCVGIDLPLAEDGLFNYIIGEGSDPDSAIVLDSMGYYDVETGDCDMLGPCRALEVACYRNFCANKAYINGILEVDQLGRVWIDSMTEDNIYARFWVKFSEGSMGYSLIRDDMSYFARIWILGDRFYFSPSSVFFYNGLPC